MPFAVRVNVGRVAFSHVCFFRSMLPTRHKEGLTQFGKISLDNFSTLYQGLNPVLSAVLHAGPPFKFVVCATARESRVVQAAVVRRQGSERL